MKKDVLGELTRNSPTSLSFSQAFRLLQLKLNPADWKHTLVLPEQSKSSGFGARFSSLDVLSQVADTPIPLLVWNQFACGSTSPGPTNISVNSDLKALSVQIAGLPHTCVEMPC